MGLPYICTAQVSICAGDVVPDFIARCSAWNITCLHTSNSSCIGTYIVHSVVIPKCTSQAAQRNFLRYVVEIQQLVENSIPSGGRSVRQRTLFCQCCTLFCQCFGRYVHIVFAMNSARATTVCQQCLPLTAARSATYAMLSVCSPRTVGFLLDLTNSHQQ